MKLRATSRALAGLVLGFGMLVAVQAAAQVGFPVVVKLLSSKITHKSDIGGVQLNLADVDCVDSTGLGHLVSAVASVRKMKGDLKLLKLTNKVHDVLQVTKLNTVIDIMDDEAVAIESFDRALTASK